MVTLSKTPLLSCLWLWLVTARPTSMAVGSAMEAVPIVVRVLLLAEYEPVRVLPLRTILNQTVRVPGLVPEPHPRTGEQSTGGARGSWYLACLS
jgi:hypothetical protein